MPEDRGQLALQIRIGLFVLVSLAVLIGLIYLLSAQARYFEPKYELVAEFTEVGGLTPGATVRLAGVQIGRVTRVSLPERPGAKVRVSLSIARRFGDRIRRNSVARIETQGLLGDKIVEISLGTSEAPPLKPGESIASRDPVEVSRLAGEGVEILRNLAALSGTLRTTVETFNETKALEDLSAVLRSAKRLTEQVEKGSGWLHVLIYDEPEVLRRLNGVLTSTEQLLSRSARGESAVGVLLSAESGRAARQLLLAMEALGKLAEGGKAEEGLLAALLFDPRYKSVAEDLRSFTQDLKPVTEDLQVLARNFRAVSERLAQGKGIAGSLLQDEGESPMGQAAKDFRVGVANLRAITDRLAAGEGTIGGLIEDPTVYENLAAFLEGAQRSAILRYLIRSAISAGKDKR
ncbi:MAG: MCE family protein [Candidatus Rokubacteria bacterium]|nr:MCE family protein [Candidatus Rokubacteria bacterium]